MELYRVLSTPLDQSVCFCDRYIKKLYRIACPELPSGDEVLDLEKLTESEAKIFFPREAVRDFITQSLIKDITECPCSRCEPFVPRSGERTKLVKQVFDSPAGASLIVANLIYLRETRRLYEISKSTDFADGIDSVTLTGHPTFEKNFSRTKALFKPPTLKLGHTESRYEPGTRLPFINEQYCDEGSFGVVTSFEIHPDYINGEVRDLVHGYISRPGEVVPPTTKLLFARKSIRGARNQSLKDEVDLERDVLGVIAAQEKDDKEHLMDLIAFFTFGDEINLVFPYVAGNLEKFLCGQWQTNIDIDEEFPANWISRGIIGLAKGLKTIHDPPTQPQLAEKGKIVGFHFDLKPGNILITLSGIFKITDFGQALIKLVKVGESTSGSVRHLGGDPRYAPPEDMPTREQVKRSSQSYKYSGDNRSASALPRIALDRPLRQVEVASSSRLEIPASHRQSQASSRSVALPQEPLGSAKYDIWSLACVMLETLIHTCLGGTGAVADFRAKLHQSGQQGAFHTGQGANRELKACVEDQLAALEGGINATAPRTSPVQAYMQNYVRLMRSMLKISENDRPDAASVAEDLERAAEKFKISKTDKDGLVDAIRERSPQRSSSTLYEVAIDETRTSFADIEGIHVQDFGSSAGFLKCRIKVYANKPSKGDDSKPEIIIYVAFKGSGRVEVQPLQCVLSETWFSPLYLNTSSESSWADNCRLKTKDFDKRFWFPSKQAELLSFQAILFHYIIEPGSVTPESSPTMLSWNLYRSISTPPKVLLTMNDYTEIELKPHAVQIWTARQHTYVSRLQSQATSTSTTSSGQKTSRTRLVLFLSSEKNAKTGKQYDMLQIPLEPRLGAIKEGSQAHKSNTMTTSLSFVPTDPYTTNGVFAAILTEVRCSSSKTPILNLDPEIYKQLFSPPEQQRTRGIKIFFHDLSAERAIETIKHHFEAANESNKPKIAWTERRALRSTPRRPRS